MSNTVLKPVWAGNEFRLDPERLPQSMRYASRSEQGDITISLDHRGAILRKTLPQSGLPISFALPARAFKGIAARAIDHGDGCVTVTLELHHSDPDLSVPLLVAHDLDDIAADWRAWSELYRIPMLMIEADGIAHPLDEQIGDVQVKSIRPRRRSVFMAARRPRFLMRRATGRLGVRMKIKGREIVARR